MREAIPTDSQIILWGGHASPFYSRINARVGEPESWPWIDALHEAAMGSVREQPLAFVKSSVAGAASQFTHFAALDDQCPSDCKLLGFTAARPFLRQSINNSRQVKDQVPKQAIRVVTSVPTVLSLFFLGPFLWIAWRIRDGVALSFLLSIVAALVLNAALAGALSDVHDRYQSRLVWLAPMAVLLLLMRWTGPPGRRRRFNRQRARVVSTEVGV